MRETKICSACGVEKPATVEYFSPQRKYLNRRCKPCANAAAKAWRLANLDKARANDKVHREANADKKRATTKAWQLANPEKQRSCAKSWYLANPQKHRAKSARRRAHTRNATGSHTAADIARLHAEQSGLCSYCSISLPLGYHVDHVVPLSRGGSNAPDNLRLTCPRCNLSKGAKLISEIQTGT